MVKACRLNQNQLRPVQVCLVLAVAAGTFGSNQDAVWTGVREVLEAEAIVVAPVFMMGEWIWVNGWMMAARVRGQRCRRSPRESARVTETMRRGMDEPGSPLRRALLREFVVEEHAHGTWVGWQQVHG